MVVEGEILVRDDCVAAQYHNDATASAKMFKGSWFWPGDLGQLDADGLSRVVGLVNKMINIVGDKVLPHAMEAAATACTGANDTAVYVKANRERLSVMLVAVVPSEGQSPRTYLKLSPTCNRRRPYHN